MWMKERKKVRAKGIECHVKMLRFGNTCRTIITTTIAVAAATAMATTTKTRTAALFSSLALILSVSFIVKGAHTRHTYTNIHIEEEYAHTIHPTRHPLLYNIVVIIVVITIMFYIFAYRLL